MDLFSATDFREALDSDGPCITGHIIWNCPTRKNINGLVRVEVV